MKYKTPQQIQLQGERILLSIDKKTKELKRDIDRLEDWRSKTTSILNDLEDPYALIPKDYHSFDEWIAEHPFPYSCICNIYKNKTKAERASYCCYVYQEDYHIVPCEPKEFYKHKYKEKFK